MRGQGWDPANQTPSTFCRKTFMPPLFDMAAESCANGANTGVLTNETNAIILLLKIQKEDTLCRAMNFSVRNAIKNIPR